MRIHLEEHSATYTRPSTGYCAGSHTRTYSWQRTGSRILLHQLTIRITPSSVPTSNRRRNGSKTELVTCILFLGIFTPLRSLKYDWFNRNSSHSNDASAATGPAPRWIVSRLFLSYEGKLPACNLWPAMQYNTCWGFGASRPRLLAPAPPLRVSDRYKWLKPPPLPPPYPPPPVPRYSKAGSMTVLADSCPSGMFLMFSTFLTSPCPPYPIHSIEPSCTPPPPPPCGCALPNPPTLPVPPPVPPLSPSIIIELLLPAALFDPLAASPPPLLPPPPGLFPPPMPLTIPPTA
mmetsp:Transcript_21852/g.36905  ORF Transcript_21852/g.36905 Transcript_21852/m.36905 type:complete len:290 (-) Transcript_21852:38-907(-)